jgi:hypothetical protein
MSGKTYLLTLIEVVINISDEVVRAAANLALTLLKKLPNIRMEQHLIRELVTDVRLNPVRPNVGCWCVLLLVQSVSLIDCPSKGDITILRQGESAKSCVVSSAVEFEVLVQLCHCLP